VNRFQRKMILKFGGKAAGGASCGGMQIQMRKAESLEPEAIDAFLRASEAIEFTGQDRKEVYGWGLPQITRLIRISSSPPERCRSAP
jgi:hypothetical protein